jgi:hypothetical protein
MDDEMQTWGKPFGYVIICTFIGVSIGGSLAQVRVSIESNGAERYTARIKSAERAVIFVPVFCSLGIIAGLLVEKMFRHVNVGERDIVSLSVFVILAFANLLWFPL